MKDNSVSHSVPLQLLSLPGSGDVEWNFLTFFTSDLQHERPRDGVPQSKELKEAIGK